MGRKRLLKRYVMLGLAIALIGVLGCGGVDSSTEIDSESVPIETTIPEDTLAEETVEESVEETLATMAAETSLEESETVGENFAEVTTDEETSSSASDVTEKTPEPVETGERVIEPFPAEIPATQETPVETQATDAPTTETPTTEVPTTEAPTVHRVEASVKDGHYIGDTLSAGDFTVKVTMSDGTVKKNPAGWYADQLYLGSAQTVITVGYEGVTTVITVEVGERPTEAPTQAQATEENPNQDQNSGQQQSPQTPATPQIDRGMAEAAWNIQKDIIAREGMSEVTWEHTGSNIQWSESLYQLCCQRVMEITTNFSHEGSPDFAAENIAKWCYDATEVVEGWYNSPGHKKNMLAGWYYGAIAYYDGHWVALFAMHE